MPLHPAVHPTSDAEASTDTPEAAAQTLYKARVAAHINQTMDATGLTLSEFTRRMGLPKPNYVSMLRSPNSADLLPLTRLPALRDVCSLSAREVLELAHLRVAGGRQVLLDTETLDAVVAAAREHAGDARPGAPS